MTGVQTCALPISGPPAPIDLDELEARLDRPEYAPVAKSLEEIGFYAPTDMLATYAAHAADLRGWLAGAEINRDRNLRLQYLAGQGLNLYRADLIFNDMLKHAQPPPDRLFAGSRDTLAALKGKILVFLGRAPDPGV